MGVVHGNNFTSKRSTAKLSWTRPCWIRQQLVGAGWVQRLKKKKKLPSNVRARMASLGDWTVLSIGRVGHAFIHYFISSYAFLLLAAKTARTPPSWPEILFFDTFVMSQDAFRRTFGLVFGATNSKQRFDTLAFTWKRLQGTCSVSYLCPLFS